MGQEYTGKWDQPEDRCQSLFSSSQ